MERTASMPSRAKFPAASNDSLSFSALMELETSVSADETAVTMMPVAMTASSMLCPLSLRNMRNMSVCVDLTRHGIHRDGLRAAGGAMRKGDRRDGRRDGVVEP